MEENVNTVGLDELREKKLSTHERVEQIVQSLGLTGNERSVISGLKEKDVFRLVNMSKVELTNQANNDFVPIVFGTNLGGTIGARQFIGVNIDEEAPGVGSTPRENAAFLVWCIDHKVEFRVRRVDTEEIPERGNIPAYTRRSYVLVVEDYEA